jgi:glycerophosphoryl diester phosphodiesterase
MRKYGLRSALAIAVALSLGVTGCQATTPPALQGCFNPAPQQPRELLSNWQRQLRWPAAHRGDRTAGPENSLAAITAGARHRIPLIEIDVQQTRDGSLFLFHDRRLHPHNFKGPAHLIGREVRTLSHVDLQLLSLPAPSTERIPVLSRAFESIRGFPSALLLDLKGESEDLADRAARLAIRKRVSRQVIIQCQRPGTARFLRQHYPEVAILARCHEPAHVDIALSISPSPEIVQIDQEWASREFVDRIHAAGAAVLIKTLGPDVDTPENWNQLLELGVDIVLTDRPRDFQRSMSKGCG